MRSAIRWQLRTCNNTTAAVTLRRKTCSRDQVLLDALKATIFMFVAASVVTGRLPAWAQGPTAEAAAGAADELAVAEPTEHPNPAVAAVLQSNPTTPAALLRAVILLTDLGEADRARPFLQQLTEANLDDAQKAALWQQFGSAALLRLGNARPLAPAGTELASTLIAAAHRHARDPGHIAALIAQLGDATPRVRYAARVDLLRIKTDAVAALLHALADAGQTKIHPEIRGVLAGLGPLSSDPISGALATTDPRLKADLIAVTGAMGSDATRLIPLLVGPATTATDPAVRAAAQQALTRLLGRVPDKSTAEQILKKWVHRYLTGSDPMIRDEEDRVTVWHWDDTSHQIQPHRYPDREAAVLLAARLAAELVSIDSDRKAYRRLNVLCRLAADKLREGFDKRLPRGLASGYQLAVRMGPQGVEDVLEFALAHDQIAAALGAVEVLGDVGNADLVRGTGEEPAALVRAACSGDRRLRFAATNVILKLDPSRPFPGSSVVPEALGYFTSTARTRRALVADPRAGEGQRVVGMLDSLGYDVDLARNGRQLLASATQSADVELALIRMTIDRPPVREILYRLRRDPRTARLPIALIASTDNWQQADDIAAAHPWTLVFGRPLDRDSVERLVTRLTQVAGRGAVPLQERQAEAIIALQHFAKLASRPRSLYDIDGQLPQIERALWVQPLRPYATQVLMLAGRASSQKRLLELANQGVFDLQDRQLAAAAFRSNVARHGILLTSREILRQYDRYNASEHADRSTQQLLASILDTLEKKDLAAE
jgi:CheY-like chemotaxis protein